jgi:hypothetical protein
MVEHGENEVKHCIMEKQWEKCAKDQRSWSGLGLGAGTPEPDFGNPMLD